MDESDQGRQHPRGVIRFRLNSSPVAVEVDPEAMLLHVLRNHLDACGTRFGCGVGECGACFVMVNGHACPSCTLPMSAVVGKDVVSVEGLGTLEAPHPLQAAFIEQQAIQCGYCASGILIRAAALLRSNPAPTETEVRSALANNLCRCGSHNRMVAAVLRAAEVLSSNTGMST